MQQSRSKDSRAGKLRIRKYGADSEKTEAVNKNTEITETLAEQSAGAFSVTGIWQRVQYARNAAKADGGNNNTATQ